MENIITIFHAKKRGPIVEVEKLAKENTLMANVKAPLSQPKNSNSYSIN